MKILSVFTQDLSRDRKVISFSKTVFKKKPFCDIADVFWFEPVRQSIKQHISKKEGVELFNVTVSTTKGKFIQGYYPDAIKDSNETR